MPALFNVPVKRILVIALVMSIGCRESDKNSSLIFEELNESLERSNKLVANSSSVILESLKSKVDDPATTEKAKIWLSTADSIYSTEKHLIGFIDSLKSNLKQNRIVVGKATSDDLFKKMIAFKEFVADKILRYKTGLNADIDILRRGVVDNTNFYDTYFFNNTVEGIITELSKFENVIAIATNEIISYCHNQITGPHCKFFEKNHAIAVSNSTVLQKGQEMVVQAGVGEFSVKSNPVFEINGVTVLPNSNGIGEYKMRIKNSPGDYKLHVKIKYIETDCQEVTLEKDIEYKVIYSPPNEKKAQVSDTTVSP